MRNIALIGCAVLIAGCSTKEAPPAADTTPVAAEPAAPAALTLESLAGTWNFRVMPMDGDSTLTTHVLTASADPAGWSFVQPNGDKVVVRDVIVAGDSITSVAGPFSSGVRSGMKVRDLRTTYRLQDGKLVGVTTARYETTGADSVRQFRLEGTKQ
jgi:hypothetical protein